MPNWCENKLSVQGATPALQAYLNEHGFSFARMCPVEETSDESLDVARQQAGWGTRWDLSEQEGNLVAADLLSGGEAFFNTAWSPPVGALRALSLRCPDDTLRLDYHEPGMMFAGSATFRGGVVRGSHVEDGPSVMRIGREVFGHEDEDGRVVSTGHKEIPPGRSPAWSAHIRTHGGTCIRLDPWSVRTRSGNKEPWREQSRRGDLLDRPPPPTDRT